jgi:hypothetical protein
MTERKGPFEDWRLVHLSGYERAYMFCEVAFNAKSAELIEVILVKPTWGFPQSSNQLES